MIYEVWYKNGINLDYFGSWEAADKYIDEYVAKHQARTRTTDPGRYTKDDFEIREKMEPANNKGVVIPGCNWPGGKYDL